jgi:hypothetical protein
MRIADCRVEARKSPIGSHQDGPLSPAHATLLRSLVCGPKTLTAYSNPVG